MLHLHLLLAIALPTFLLNPLVSLVLPAVAGTITAALYQWIKKASSWIDGLQGQTHVIIIGAISIVLPQIAKFIPGFPVSLDGFTSDVLQPLVLLTLTQITHLFLAGPSKPTSVAAPVPAVA